MVIRTYSFDHSEYLNIINQIKDMTIQTLHKEGKITKEDAENYLENYAVITVDGRSFTNFCKKLFNLIAKEEDNNIKYYFKMVKNV